MNGPSKAQTCLSDINYCKFGSEVFLRLLPILAKQLNGIIKNDNIEYVHKTRVTSRRLRAAMPLFKVCFPRKEFKKWFFEIKKLTRLLADARDLDVQIVFLEQYMKKKKTATEKADMETLLNSHKDRRKRIQPSIVRELDKMNATDILGGIHKYCEQIIIEQSNHAFNPQTVLEKARWHISFSLDDFLAMETYVFMEKEILKHHEMRIYAKKLRYTMEAFAALYKSKLEREIESIKRFQDILGEMHDCDVWAEYIPKFIQEINAKNKLKKISNSKGLQALFNFLNYVQEKRKQHYKELVSLWEETKTKGFFVQLTKTINAEFTARKKEKIKLTLTNPTDKIAVLSDIHANLHALQRVTRDAQKKGCCVFLNAGDSIGFGPYPNEVIEYLCEKNVVSILGNYDLEVIEGKARAKGQKKLALDFARKELSKSCECYLYSLPRELRLEMAGKKLLMVHGSPASIDEHIYHDTPTEQLKMLANDAKVDVVIVGHSHEQFWRQTDVASFINPGSVGRPGDGNPQAAYAILTFNPFKVELVRIDYDVEGAANALRKRGLPEIFSQMLLCGESLDAVIKEDQIRKGLIIQDCRETVKVSAEISEKYWPDAGHCAQVRKLALLLFDELSKMHKFGMHERCWLECAAILHDVGLSKSRVGHNKKSAKIILNDTQLPFSSQERRIIASISRYHRKALPKEKHYNLTTLNRETRHKIEVLSSFLRVADSLDYTHQSIVEVLNIKMSAKRIIVECISEMKSKLEEQAFNNKKDLFEKIFDKKMVLTWKKPPKLQSM
jgi:putative phosphoesterase